MLRCLMYVIHVNDELRSFMRSVHCTGSVHINVLSPVLFHPVLSAFFFYVPPNSKFKHLSSSILRKPLKILIIE